MTAALADELVASLRSLAAALPVPDPSWHPHVAAIRALRDDLLRAVAVAERFPEALDLVAAAIDGELEEPFDEGADPGLAAAYARLGAVPVPSGQHPYLDEILPTLEAAEATLVALSLVPAAARAFSACS